MHKHSPGRGAARPTPFEDLNGVLAELVSRVRDVLGANFVGAYLHGSFALGDFDAHSDVDFAVVVERDLGPSEVTALNEAHEAIHGLPCPWAQHLDGSYVPRAILRRWSQEPRDPPGEPRGPDWSDPGTAGSPPQVYPFWYLDNGARSLVRSEHDNTRVVRWSLRERGVVLAGPEPRSLVEAVPAEALREEVRGLLQALAARAGSDPSLTELQWVQAFMAVLGARMLHTLATGRVSSKAAAVTFARQALEPRWAGLVERAWAQRRSQPRGPDAPAAFAARRSDPGEAAETVAFLEAAPALEAAGPAAAARSALERKLARRRQAPPNGRGPGPSGFGARGDARGGWKPPPIRPGGRGRRG